MNANDILSEIEFERADEYESEFITGYRDSHGSYRLGSIDSDPEMSHFEDIVDLASSLRRRW